MSRRECSAWGCYEERLSLRMAWANIESRRNGSAFQIQICAPSKLLRRGGQNIPLGSKNLQVVRPKSGLWWTSYGSWVSCPFIFEVNACGLVQPFINAWVFVAKGHLQSHEVCDSSLAGWCLRMNKLVWLESWFVFYHDHGSGVNLCFSSLCKRLSV